MFKTKPRKNYCVYNQGGAWGQNITVEIKDRDRGILSHSGHWTPKPVKGDILLTQFQSGRVVVSVFTKVENCGNPPDMFFAESKCLGYLDELGGFDTKGVAA